MFVLTHTRHVQYFRFHRRNLAKRLNKTFTRRSEWAEEGMDPREMLFELMREEDSAFRRRQQLDASINRLEQAKTRVRRTVQHAA